MAQVGTLEHSIELDSSDDDLAQVTDTGVSDQNVTSKTDAPLRLSHQQRQSSNVSEGFQPNSAKFARGKSSDSAQTTASHMQRVRSRDVHRAGTISKQSTGPSPPQSTPVNKVATTGDSQSRGLVGNGAIRRDKATGTTTSGSAMHPTVSKRVNMKSKGQPINLLHEEPRKSTRARDTPQKSPASPSRLIDRNASQNKATLCTGNLAQETEQEKIAHCLRRHLTNLYKRHADSVKVS